MGKKMINNVDVRINKYDLKKGSEIAKGVTFTFFNGIEKLFTDTNRIRILPSAGDVCHRIYFVGLSDDWKRTGYKEFEYAMHKANYKTPAIITSGIRASTYDFTKYIGEYNLEFDDSCNRYYIQVTPEEETVIEQPKVITDAPAVMSIKDFDPNAIYAKPCEYGGISSEVSSELSSFVYYTITNETMKLLKRNLEFLGYSYDDLTTVDLEYEQRKKEAYETYLKLKEEFGFD